MPRNLHSTLGFFVHGIPVIFVKTRTFFESGSSGSGYADFLRKCKAEGVEDRPLNDDLCRSYEQFITVLHEVRHFHDSLLCKPLFEKFLLQHKVTWYVMQLVGRLAGHGKLPLSAKDPFFSSTPEIVELKERILAADTAAYTLYPTLWDRHMVDGTSIDLTYLLEASAITSELLHLYSVHGIRAVQSYFETVIGRLDEHYNILIKMFVPLYGGLLPGLSALYAACGYSLYSSEDPTSHFARLFTRLKADRSVVYKEAFTWLSNPFAGEEGLSQRVLSSYLVNPVSGHAIRMFDNADAEYMDELATLHYSMYGFRKLLIDKYIVEFEYNAGKYFEHLGRLPIPPVLFYPQDAGGKGRIMEGVLESDLRRRGDPYYIIAGYDDGSDKAVLAGLTTFPGLRSCVGLTTADMLLLNQYFYSALFQGKHELYSPPVDDAYLRVLQKVAYAEQ